MTVTHPGCWNCPGRAADHALAMPGPESTPVRRFYTSKLRLDDAIDAYGFLVQAAQFAETLEPRFVLARLGAQFFRQGLRYQFPQGDPWFGGGPFCPPGERVGDVEGGFHCRPACYHKVSPLIDAIPDILARIVARKREDLAPAARHLDQWERQADARRAARRDFRAALCARVPAVIAEVKKASPSKGVLCADFDPARIAAEYRRGGAAAISVLTDESFFQGSLADLEAVRAVVDLPVLRKDFTIAHAQIVEAAAHGADAILLIAAILGERELRDFREAAARYGMAALVEVHNRRELDAAIASGAAIIGVNNRNLSTFEVTLETSLRLAEHIPAGVVRVSESGIHDAADVARLRAAGYSVFLVGEHLMKSGDPSAALAQLVAA